MLNLFHTIVFPKTEIEKCWYLWHFCIFEYVLSQQTQNICITFIQRWPSVFDVGPTLYKCYKDILRLLGCY